MAELTFPLISNKILLPLIGSVDPLIAVAAGIIILSILIFLLYKLFAKKKTIPSGQPPAGKAPPSQAQSENTRRLRRREPERALAGSPSPEPGNQKTPESKPSKTASPPEKFGHAHEEIARQLRGEQIPSRRKAHASNPDELETLAEDLAEQSDREEEAKKELEELRKKLGAPPSSEESIQPSREFAEPIQEQGEERRHGRWREQRGTRQPEKREPAGRDRRSGRRERSAGPAASGPAQSSESENQLEELKKMEFRDLLKESEETGEKKSDEEELKELEGEEGSGELFSEENEGPVPCPNCKRKTEKIVYCPECGTAFCSQCAKAFKKQANAESCQCPSCETYVKKQE